MRNVIKRVYSMGLRNFHVKKDSMIINIRPYSPPHRCYCGDSLPTQTSMAEEMNSSSSSSDCLPLPFEGFRRMRSGHYGRRKYPPRHQYKPGLLALLDGDPRVLGSGYDYQGGYEHDMCDTPGYADDSSDVRFWSSAYSGRASGNIQTYSSNSGNTQGYSSSAGNIESTGSDSIPGVYPSLETQGQVLLEVFSVRIIDCENSGYLYGTIEFEDGPFPVSVYLYNRQSSDSEPVSQDGTLSLTGPHCGISILGYYDLRLKLKDKDGNLFPSNYASLSGDLAIFEDNDLCDELLKKYFYGNSVSVAVYYTIFSDAVQAKVEVEVVKGHDEDGADQVYGRVVARYSDYDYSSDEQKKYFQTVLFDKSENNYVEVEPGKPIIPLSRYVVAVPTISSLIIEANLWVYDKLKKPDDQIAKGAVLFPPKTEGVTVKNIQGDGGRVRVVVTWRVCKSLNPW